MSTNLTDFAALAGDFRDAWANSMIEPFKSITPMLEAAPFREGQLQGGYFNWPMRATIESGTTFAAPRSQPGESGTTYVGSRSTQTPAWQIEAPQIHTRSRVAYEALARSMSDVSSAEPDRKKAVKGATEVVVKGLLEGTVKKCEALMLHGRRSLGFFQGISNVVAASAVAGNENANGFDGNPAGFVVDVQITDATWAEAIFVQCEGGTFDLWSVVGGVPTAKLNTTTNTVLTSGANQTGAILLAINPPTPNTGLSASAVNVLRLFHSSGTAGGTGVGIFGGAVWATLNTGCIFFESGGNNTSEYVSLTAMAQNSGTIFGVSSVPYSVAKGNSQASVGNLKLADLIRYLARPINKGAMGKRIRAIVPTELFAQFANDEATLRRYAAATGDAKNGFDNIEMYLPHKSILEIVGHNLQKQGEVLCYPTDEVIRIGAQDFDIIQRGRGVNGLILEVAQSPASEMRGYGQFAPLCESPSHMLSLTGVTF